MKMIIDNRVINKEYILCAAIHVDDDNYHPHQESNGTGKVFCGHRHHNIFSLIGDFKGKKTQGFLTNKGRFVDREEGAKIALNCGQIEKLKYNSTRLFSEDLY